MKRIIWSGIIGMFLFLVNPFYCFADDILAIKSTKLPDTFNPPALAYEYVTQDQTRFLFVQSTQVMQGYITCSGAQLGTEQDIWRNCQNLLGSVGDIAVIHVKAGNNPLVSTNTPVGIPSNIPAH